MKSVCLFGGTSKGPQISSLKSGVVRPICPLELYLAVICLEKFDIMMNFEFVWLNYILLKSHKCLLNEET